MIGSQFKNLKKRLRQIGFLKYADYLCSKTWIARRNKYEESHPKACSFCQSVASVDLHHRSYSRLGKEPDNDLVWLCWKHHKETHESGVLPKPASDMQRTFLLDLGFKAGEIQGISSWEASKKIQMKIR